MKGFFSTVLAGLFALCCAAPAFALIEPAAAPSPAPSAVRPTFVLDAGHGGDDLGAVVGHRREKDIALAITLKVRRRLQELGETGVKLTREDDRFIPLDRRVEDVADWSGNLFVSLHLNQVRRKSPHGITVYAFGKESFRLPRRHRHSKVPPLAAPPKDLARESAAFANSIVSSLRAQGLRVDNPARAGFYVLKNPEAPSVLIELGYLSNPAEAARLNDPAYQDRLADALAVSLESYVAKAGPTSLAKGR